jgi:hypothetical protein
MPRRHDDGRLRAGEIATAMTSTRVEVVVMRARNKVETFFRRDETRFGPSAMNARFYTRDKRRAVA